MRISSDQGTLKSALKSSVVFQIEQRLSIISLTLAATDFVYRTHWLDEMFQPQLWRR
jgi:hypothetical protein